MGLIRAGELPAVLFPVYSVSLHSCCGGYMATCSRLLQQQQGRQRDGVCVRVCGCVNTRVCVCGTVRQFPALQEHQLRYIIDQTKAPWQLSFSKCAGALLSSTSHFLPFIKLQQPWLSDSLFAALCLPEGPSSALYDIISCLEFPRRPMWHVS